MFGSNEGLILISAVGGMLGSTLGLDEGAYLRSSDGSLMVSMMSHLGVIDFENILGSFDGTKNEGSTMGVSPRYTEGDVLVSEEVIVPGTGELYLYL